MDWLFQIAILIVSVVVHEVAHGYAARYLGDHTAEYEGRLTLNPIKHIDPFGSVILPALLAISGSSAILGWAKPVPYNPYNLRPGRFSEAKVALAGPASNLALALIFGLLLRFFPENPAIILVVLINIVLAIFNLVPVPPLDGSKVLFALLPERYGWVREYMERWGFFAVLIIVFFFSGLLWSLIWPVIELIFGLFTGFAI